MHEIVILPPQETPAQPTVKHRSQNLQEHLMGFLNANNQHGFIEDKRVLPIDLLSIKEIMALEDASLADVLMLVTEHQYVSLDELKKLCWKIKEEVRAKIGKKNFGLGKANEMMARLLGYKTFASLHALLKEKNTKMVRNFRYQDKDIRVSVFETTDKGKFRGHPNVKEEFRKVRSKTK